MKNKILIIIAMILSIMAIQENAYAETKVEGLVSYWNFEEEGGQIAEDLAGDNNGIIYGATRLTGQVGNALSFQKGTEKVTVQDHSSLHTTTMSFEMMVKPSTSGIKHIIDKYSRSQGFFASIINNKWFFHLNGWGIYSQSTAELEKWTHFVATYDGKDFRLYINGVNETTATPWRALVNNTTMPLTIGTATFTTSYYSFKGALDEIALYNRALSAEEVKAHYENAQLGLGILSGPRVIPVEIDIKPDSADNRLNIKSNGVFPVALLTTENFDAATVNYNSVSIGPDGATADKSHIEDADGDGDLDVIFHFPTQKTGIACGDSEVMLRGETFDGKPIEGAGKIETVGCGGKL